MPSENINFDELNPKWKAKLEETFNTFIEEEIGFENAKPKCYGSGDSNDICWACPWQSTC